MLIPLMALLFGFNQSEANRWIHKPTPLFEKVLGRRLELPARRPADLDWVLTKRPALEFVLDGVERPVRRLNPAATLPLPFNYNP